MYALCVSMGKFTILFTTMQIFLKRLQTDKPASCVKKGMHSKMHPIKSNSLTQAKGFSTYRFLHT